MPLPTTRPSTLVEHRRMREIEVVAPVDGADRHQPHRRCVLLHVADLHRRRVRAQQRQRLRAAGARRRCCRPRRERRGLHRRSEIQRVLHVARGMLVGHVERFEVVVVVLDLRAFEHLIAEPGEDLLHLLAHEAERMTMADGRRAAGQRDVDRVGGTARGGERRLALGQRLFHGDLERVDLLSERLAIRWRQRRQVRHQLGDPAGLASRPGHLQPVDRARASGGSDGIGFLERASEGLFVRGNEPCQLIE